MKLKLKNMQPGDKFVFFDDVMKKDEVCVYVMGGDYDAMFVPSTGKVFPHHMMAESRELTVVRVKL